MGDRQITKARPYHLEAHEAEIRQLVATEGRTLKQVQAYFLQRYNLDATENVLKKRFKKLELNTKYNRRQAMENAALYYEACRDRGEVFRYDVSGHKVIDEHELLRYAGRQGCVIVNGVFRKKASQPRTSQTHLEGSSLFDRHLEKPITPTEVRERSSHEYPIKNSDDAGPSYTGSRSNANSSDVMLIDDEDTSLIGAKLNYNDREAREHRFAGGQPLWTEHSAHSVSCVNPTDTFLQAQAFLASRGFTRCPSIIAPDSYRYIEDLFRNIDVATATSFDSGQAVLDGDGWVDTNNGYVHMAIVWSDRILTCFDRACQHSSKVRMRQAWIDFRAGLYLLCNCIYHCLPFGISEFIDVINNLLVTGERQMIRTIAFYIHQWCKQEPHMMLVERIFANICSIEETCFTDVVKQAAWVIYEQSKRVAGEFNTTVIVSYLWAQQITFRSEKKLLKTRLEKLPKRLQESVRVSATVQLYCMIQLYEVSFQCGDYDGGKSVATQGLKLLEESRDVNHWWHYRSVFLEFLSCSLWKLGKATAALGKMEKAVIAAAKQSLQGGRQLQDTCLRLSKMHLKLGNISNANYYKQLAAKHFNIILSEVEKLDDKFRILGLEGKGNSQQDADISRSGGASLKGDTESVGRAQSSQSEQHAWRPGVTSEEQDIVLSSLCYDDEDGCMTE